MKKNGEKYECYSKKIYGYLTMKGFRYEYPFIHKKTGRKCWVYIMTPELSKALIEWSINKADTTDTYNTTNGYISLRKN